MKNRIFLMLIIIFTLLFSMFFAGCNNEREPEDIWIKITNKAELRELVGMYEANETIYVPSIPDDYFGYSLPASSLPINVKLTYIKGEDNAEINYRADVSKLLDSYISVYMDTLPIKIPNSMAKDYIWIMLTNQAPPDLDVSEKYYISSKGTIGLDDLLTLNLYTNQNKSKIKMSFEDDYIYSFIPVDPLVDQKPIEMIFYKKF